MLLTGLISGIDLGLTGVLAGDFLHRREPDIARFEHAFQPALHRGPARQPAGQERVQHRHPEAADRMRRLNRALQAQGILKGESKYYISLAHDEADVAKTLAAWSTAFDEISEKAPA